MDIVSQYCILSDCQFRQMERVGAKNRRKLSSYSLKIFIKVDCHRSTEESSIPLFLSLFSFLFLR